MNPKGNGRAASAALEETTTDLVSVGAHAAARRHLLDHLRAHLINLPPTERLEEFDSLREDVQQAHWYSLKENLEAPRRWRKVIPGELRAHAQWVVWREECRDGDWTKVPYRVERKRLASSTDPGTWSTFDAAVLAYERGGFEGIGFVFSADDPYCGIDLDNCVGADGIATGAEDVIRELAGYTEFSPSGLGVKVIVRASKRDVSRCRTRNTSWGRGQIEIYDRARFFTLTGLACLAQERIPERQAQLEGLLAELFPREPRKVALARREVNLDDRELLKRMLTASNGAAIQALWDGDTAGYGEDHSVADLALCGHLAFYTGGDPDRVNRLFRSSGLYRPKWERDDYREATISKAIAGCSDFYGAGP